MSTFAFHNPPHPPTNALTYLAVAARRCTPHCLPVAQVDFRLVVAVAEAPPAKHYPVAGSSHPRNPVPASSHNRQRPAWHHSLLPLLRPAVAAADTQPYIADNRPYTPRTRHSLYMGLGSGSAHNTLRIGRSSHWHWHRRLQLQRRG